MKDLPGKDQSGFSLIETMVAVSLLTVTMIIMITIMVSMLNMWKNGAGGTSANSNTALATRKLVLDIEEGKSAVMLNTFVADDGNTYGNRLQVTFPYYDTTTSSYIKTQNGKIITYYLSGSNGTESTGTYLWKTDGTLKSKLSKNIDTIRFKVTNGNLVGINLKGKDPENGAINPSFLQQSIKLRNS